MESGIFKRYRINTIRSSFSRFYTSNRSNYFKLLKNRVNDSENGYIRRLKRNSTSMVSVMRNGAESYLRMNKKFGKTLWQYFNSPFNVVFMTTNIFTFAGVVAFSTLIDIRHLHDTAVGRSLEHNQSQSSVPDGLLMMDTGLTRRHLYPMITTINPEHITLPELALDDVNEQLQTQNKALEFLKKKISEKASEIEKSEVVAVETPLSTYSIENVEISNKPSRVVDFKATKVKASLFNMLYAFEIYDDMLKDADSDKWYNKQWLKELNFFRNKYNIKNEEKLKFKPSLQSFYSSWRSEMHTKNKYSGRSVENFKLPKWTSYPGNLYHACNQLYENKMETVKDFQNYYENVKSDKFKKLLRMWFYDNYELINSNNTNDLKTMKIREAFYNEILTDCKQDSYLYDKYASIVLNPYNKRNQLLFNRIQTHRDKENNDAQVLKTIPVVEIDTLLNVLQGYITLQKTQKNLDYSKIFLRIVHMIKDNGYLSQDNHIGIQLCSDDQIILKRKKWLSKSRQDPKLYEELGKDPRIVDLLTQIS